MSPSKPLYHRQGSAPISGTMQDWHEKHGGSQGSPNGERTVTIDAAGNRARDGLVLQETRRDKEGWLHLLVPNVTFYYWLSA
jgi:hypothetical protein